MKKEYTRCELCPYYAKVLDNKTRRFKWDCGRIHNGYHCWFSYLCDDSDERNARMEIIKLWIKANEEKEKNKE